MIFVTFLACEKEGLGKKEVDKEIATCEWDAAKVADATIWKEYLVEPLVTSEACGCIVSGEVKYLKIGTDFAYVIYYGKGECDNTAYLVTYDDKKEKKCKFTQECDGN